MKVVINACFGGFSISLDGARWMAKKGHAGAKAEVAEWEKHKKWVDYYVKNGEWHVEVPKTLRRFLEIDAKYRTEPRFHGFGYSKNSPGGYERHDPLLVEMVETLGDKAGGKYASLKVVEIPDGVDYEISEYDGNEHIAEKHRTWA